MTVVIVWATLVFIGLLVAFGYPLTNGLTHFSHQLPSYVQSAEHGSGWIGDWLGGFFGAFVAALISIPVAGALQVIARELWLVTAWQPPDGEPTADPPPPGEDELKAPAGPAVAQLTVGD